MDQHLPRVRRRDAVRRLQGVGLGPRDGHARCSTTTSRRSRSSPPSRAAGETRWPPSARLGHRTTEPGGGGRAADALRARPRIPGVPRRWDRASILGRCANGGADRQRAAARGLVRRAAADAGRRAQRKWMREHPRWPSSSCVAAHFGSWSAALEAAGLPARRLTFETSVAERVEAARALAAAGLSAARRSRARSASRARASTTTCAPATARTAAAGDQPARDALPRLHRGTSPPSRARGRAQRCARPSATGTPSTAARRRYREWTPSRRDPGAGRPRARAGPAPPSSATSTPTRPDPWNAALRDAGADVRFRRWSDDAVRSALADFWARTGGRPRATTSSAATGAARTRPLCAAATAGSPRPGASSAPLRRHRPVGSVSPSS